MMLKCRDISVEGYERVIEAVDDEVGLHSFIAIHNTKLGPSLGGTRIYPYTSSKEALNDALRLSRGMTYKSAMAEIGLGGGKSVIIADPKSEKTEELLLAFAKAVDSLQGLYICAEDMGSTVEDMALIRTRTPYVAALAQKSSSGDPSPYTAWGCYRGVQAVASQLWGSESLENRTVAIQGLGAVGMRLAEFLYWGGARLTVADVDHEVLDYAHRTFGAKVVSSDDILKEKCDVLAPCAMGGIINSKTIPELRCQAVAGSANNQLLEPKDGETLMKKGILYAPDFVINAGGIINVAVELSRDGYDPIVARKKVDTLYEVLMSVFNISKKRKISTSQAADELAEHKLQSGIGRRVDPIRPVE